MNTYFPDSKQLNTLQVPHVTWLSRSGHLCSWQLAADGVVVSVRGTTVAVGVVVVVMFESNVVVVLMKSESFVVAVVVDRAKVVVRLENCVAFVVVFENNTSLVVVELSLEFSVVVENVVVELVVVVFELSCELTPPNQQARIAKDKVSNIPPACSILYIPICFVLFTTTGYDI